MTAGSVLPLLDQLEARSAPGLQPITVRLLVAARDDPGTDATTRERIRRVLDRTGGAS